MRRRRMLLALTAIIVSIGSGTAYGYFTASASAHGTGQASTGTMATVTIAATAGTPGTPLLPGGTGDVTLKITNPNSFSVSLVSVTGSGTVTADGLHPGCTTTGVTFNAPSPSGPTLPISIAASSTQQIDIPGAASMSAASVSACQGATFSIPVTIGVHS
jgi:predicted phage tail protein